MKETTGTQFNEVLAGRGQHEIAESQSDGGGVLMHDKYHWPPKGIAALKDSTVPAL